jgi:replicative DNA helicase
MSADGHLDHLAELYGEPSHDSARPGFRRDSRVEHLRIPPQSVEAEQAVLGGLMLAPRAWWDICDRLNEGDFYRRDHQLIWRAIKHLAESKPPKPFDAVTLGEWFEKQGLSEQVSGGAYLVELASTTPSAANIVAYAEIVHDKAILRNLIEVGTGIVNDGFQPDGRNSVELVGHALTQVSNLLTAQPSEAEHISSAMDEAFAELAERNDKGEGMDGMPTGFVDLDEILGGLVPGVHFLGGRPKHGKSTLAQNIAEYVALVQRKPVHITILEMSKKQYAKRLIASQGHVDSQRMRRGTLDQVDWASASNTVSRMRGSPLFISKPGAARIEHICAQIRRQHARTGLGLAVLDYLQLVDIITARGENYSVAVGRVTRALVNLAQDLGIAILCLSQLSRDAEENSRPKTKHLRDSGSIEADAESVIFVYNDEVNDRNSRYAGTIEVIVAANRNGPSGECRLLFNGAQYRCENLPFGWEPAPLPEKADKPKRGFKKSGNVAADAAAGDA